MKEVACVVVIVAAVYIGLNRFSNWLSGLMERRARRDAEILDQEREPWGV